MNEQPALLAAILATPDDDDARLVYADWLDEHDQRLRAEFIRVQCEEARLSAREVYEDLGRRELTRRTELRARERALLRRLKRAFLAEAGPHHERCALCLARNMTAQTPVDTISLGRGFFEALTADAGTWPLSAELLRNHPLRVINFEGNLIRIWIRNTGGAWSTWFDEGSRVGPSRNWASRAAMLGGIVAWVHSVFTES